MKGVLCFAFGSSIFSVILGGFFLVLVEFRYLVLRLCLFLLT